MKVILLTTDYNLPANICVKAFLQNTLLQKYDIEVVGMVITSMFFPLEKKSWRAFFRFIKRSGLSFAGKSIAFNILQNLKMNFAKSFVPDKKRKYFLLKELARRYGIPVLSVQDINAPEVLDFVSEKNPEYLVSAHLLQIVKKELLEVPLQGSINIHPALFQEHRGVFSSFWMLLRNQRQSGATVHFMSEKLDDGKIILQRNFFIQRSDSIHSVDEKAAKLGGNLLAKALVKLVKRSEKTFWIQSLSKLFTMPTENHARTFSREGKKFFVGATFLRSKSVAKVFLPLFVFFS
jgi:folate-dependent phosphoribosylglycinamide formyltransferase PurN